MTNRTKGWCTLCAVAAVGWMATGCSSTPTTGTEAPGAPVPNGAAGQSSTPAIPAANPPAPNTPTPTTPPPVTPAMNVPAIPMTPPTNLPTAPVTPVTPPANAGGAPAVPPVAMPTTPGIIAYPDLRGGCTINSGYPDDKACIPPPAAEEGLQIHIGPKDYTNKAEVARFIMKPGEESSECYTFHTPNETEVYYQTFTLSGRAGTHHVINTMYRNEMADGGFGPCADPGTGTNGNIIDNLPGASKAYMPRGQVAPENKNIGRKIPPKTAAQADMHYYNFTDKDLIREIWMNVYFAKKEEITQTADQIRAMGGLLWSITPGTDRVYKYECPISGNGRIMALLGHYHAHGKHFTASVRRKAGGMTEKVFEMYDFMDPAMFEYDTIQKNPAFTATNAGAVSGLLDVKDGDVLMWDCHIINDSNVTLTYTNEVKTGEMCNLWGSSLGIKPLNCVIPTL